ncbi:hypothetical protein ABT009_42455 [Streptomyces sp. NPDC002896]|uniref:hypothetical protein n=1 Tax=Streptomyces sp. NPDC002896 TaxID=3154438 RepID=UPI003328CC60
MAHDPYAALNALVRAEVLRDSHSHSERRPADPERKADPEHPREQQPDERDRG